MGERCEQTAKQEPSSPQCLSSAHTHTAYSCTAPRTPFLNRFSEREGGGGGRACLCTGLFGIHFGRDFNPSSLLELLFEVGPVWQGRPRRLLHLLRLFQGSAGPGDLRKGLFHPQPWLTPVAVVTPAPTSVPSSWYQHSNHLLGLPWCCTKVIFNTFILIQISIACFVAQESWVFCKAVILPVFLIVWIWVWGGFFLRYTCCANIVQSEQLDMQWTSLLLLTDQDKIVQREIQTWSGF